MFLRYIDSGVYTSDYFGETRFILSPRSSIVQEYVLYQPNVETRNLNSDELNSQQINPNIMDVEIETHYYYQLNCLSNIFKRNFIVLTDLIESVFQTIFFNKLFS